MAQELLQHAHLRITMGIYQQAVVAEKRVAQDRVLAGLISSTLRRAARQSIQAKERIYL
jgi:hypothetical protein